jgi:hypothetical protein
VPLFFGRDHLRGRDRAMQAALSMTERYDSQRMFTGGFARP